MMPHYNMLGLNYCTLYFFHQSIHVDKANELNVVRGLGIFAL